MQPRPASGWDHAVNAYDPTLVTDLAKVAADALAWDWPAVPAEHIPSPAECTTDVVEAILDRLLELGWRPPEQPTPQITVNIEPPPPRLGATLRPRTEWFRG